MTSHGSRAPWPVWMLVSSGALVILTAGADPWTWMVLATAGVAITWLALTYVGAWLQRAGTWLRGGPSTRGRPERASASEVLGPHDADDGSDLSGHVS